MGCSDSRKYWFNMIPNEYFPAKYLHINEHLEQRITAQQNWDVREIIYYKRKVFALWALGHRYKLKNLWCLHQSKKTFLAWIKSDIFRVLQRIPTWAGPMLFWVLALPGGSLRACAFALFFGQIHTIPHTHKHPPPHTKTNTTHTQQEEEVGTRKPRQDR